MTDPLLIAIDYDGTYTADPEGWNVVIMMLKARGHSVICCTHRNYDERIERDIGCIIYYTERKAKRPFLAKLGIRPHIWIDDNPHWIDQGSC